MIATYSFSQINELSDDIYDAILINDISLIEIERTKGDSLQLSSLIGNVVELKRKEYGIESDNELIYYFEGLQLYFSRLCQSDNYCLVNFEARSITVSNIKLEIGKSISSFKHKLKFNIGLNGEKSIIFTRGQADCCPIVVEYDNDTEIVTRIFFFEQT